MTMQDRQGNPVSTASRAAIDGFDDAAELLLGYYADPLERIDRVLADEPGFVMGHVFRAALMATATDKAALPLMRASVEAAEALRDRANDRERGHVAALRAWLSGNLAGAMRLYGAVLDAYPRDSLALQIAHTGDFFLGQSTMLRDRVAAVLPHWNHGVPGYGYVLGMHAFGLEETGAYEAAEATGRMALSLNARDPWAVHAVAHVMEMQGRADEGVRWLTERRDDWAPNNMFSFHNWWHLALYHLDRGETDRVLEIYDAGIRPAGSDVVLEMVDGTAMLWRLHLLGVDVGGRWAELADRWERTAGDAHYAFNDMHAMMAFVADRRDEAAGRMMAAMERRVGHGGTNAMMTREVGLPVVRALRAFADGDHATAAALLARVRPTAHHFGGSHAQRDVLTLTLAEAARRGGDAGLAGTLGAERARTKPESPFSLRFSQALAA